MGGESDSASGLVDLLSKFDSAKGDSASAIPRFDSDSANSVFESAKSDYDSAYYDFDCGENDSGNVKF